MSINFIQKSSSSSTDAHFVVIKSGNLEFINYRNFNMDCGTSLVKYILFIFNAIVLVISIECAFFCMVILKTIGELEGNGEAVLPVFLLVLCSIAIFISILGCYGACQKSIFITRSYAVILLIQIILHLTLFVLMSTNKEQVEQFVGDAIDYAWNSSHKEGGTFDTIQKWFYCCGRDSPNDYNEVGHTKPSSCYNGTHAESSLYKGCNDKIIKYMYLATDKFVVISVISLQLIFFIFSCCFANSLGVYKRQKALPVLSTSYRTHEFVFTLK